MLKRGEADAMICGIQGRFHWHRRYVMSIIGNAEGVSEVSTLTSLVTPKGTFFFCDTHISYDPSSKQLVEMTLMAVKEMKRFGIEPRVALLSHSNMGSSDTHTSLKVREAVRMLHEDHPDLMVEGEMHADNALDEDLRKRSFPNSKLDGTANLFIMPNLDSANISFNMIRKLADGLVIGPIMIGAAKPAHVMTASVTARGIVNMSAVAVAEAMEEERKLL